MGRMVEPVAAVIRTLPNEAGKRTRDYTDLVPPYLTREAVAWLVEKRIDGLPAMLKYYAPWEGKIKVERFEILNPEVVVSDGLALFTYNLVNYIKDDEGNEVKGSCWNCTEVYCEESKGWKIIHSHWSFTAHEAFRGMTPEQSEAG